MNSNVPVRVTKFCLEMATINDTTDTLQLLTKFQQMKVKLLSQYKYDYQQTWSGKNQKIKKLSWCSSSFCKQVPKLWGSICQYHWLWSNNIHIKKRLCSRNLIGSCFKCFTFYFMKILMINDYLLFVNQYC